MSIEKILGKFKGKWSKRIATVIIVVGAFGVYAGMNFLDQITTKEVTCVVNEKSPTVRKNETEAYEVTCNQERYYIISDNGKNSVFEIRKMYAGVEVGRKYNIRYGMSSKTIYEIAPV